MKLLSVVGARPQFIKLMPLARALKDERKNIKHVIVHSGQHYDYNMSKVFFDQLLIPKVDYHLNVGSASHALQTAEILKRIEAVLIKEKPDWVIVYGDTNTTLAAALAAVKLNLPIAHIEAGLRSFDRMMPEEANRILTDRISSILFCPGQIAMCNLRRERCRQIAVNCGDIMYDAMLLSLEAAQKKSQILFKNSLSTNGYYLATIHRAENTDNLAVLKKIVYAFLEISKNNPVIWPMHPRAAKLIKDLKITGNLMLIEPVSYFDMLILEKNAAKILTDSGGVQKEAYWLKVPCVTLRDETEWLETIKCKCNVLVGTNYKKITQAAGRLNSSFKFKFHNLYGNGRAAEKIVDTLKRVRI